MEEPGRIVGENIRFGEKTASEKSLLPRMNTCIKEYINEAKSSLQMCFLSFVVHFELFRVKCFL